MKRCKYLQVSGTFLGIVGILGLMGVIVFSMKSLPQSMGSAYPQPIDEYPTAKPVTTITPEELIPPPSPVSNQKAISLEDSFYKRPAKVGTIFETGLSPFHSALRIVNQWLVEVEEKRIIAFAGAQVNAPDKGGQALPEPWPGILIIEVTTTQGEFLPDESGEYLTNENVGPLRIIDADHDEITLVTRGGKIYIFDLKSKSFTRQENESVIVRQVSKGSIWESGNIPFPIDEFEFENYWYLSEEGEEVFVFAGAKKADEKQVVLIKYSINPIPNQTTCVVFYTPVKDGSSRLVDMIDNKLIIVTSSGIMYGFDVMDERLFNFDQTTLKFSPLDEEIFKVPLLIKQEEPDENGITITPTITPSITPLPTLTPLPYP